MSKITVFQTKKIITIDPNCPVATHVAVQDGKILAVGAADCADEWGVSHTDTRLADTVLMPGFVEAHAHMLAGAIWNYGYAGYHDRIDPNGKLWTGLTNIEAVIDGLKTQAQSLPEGAPLVAWGFDPIFLTDERLSRHHLDQISPTRPIAVLFSNFHLMCVNSAALELAEYSQYTNVEGVVKGPDGQPTGELQEMAAMFPVMHRLGIDFRNLGQTEQAIRSYGAVARQAGVTTVTDLFSMMEEGDLKLMQRVTSEPGFPVRIVPAMAATGARPEQLAQRAIELRGRSTDKLRLGAVKLMTDGSIQGWTARVKWPGYVGGQPNGIWNTAPTQIGEICDVMHREGVQMHIHVNGDEASEVVINALDAASRNTPGQDNRHVLQHGQMMGADQFQRCAELGITVNLFANHIWYFGDQHVALTIGNNRATRMNACRTALDCGVHLAIHSDAPVTPMGPLFTAWCAVNRQTMSGRTLGAAQCISVDEALYAITLGAAYSLKMEAEIGSIETGKIADFAILGADPTAVDAQDLKDVPVLGTVSGGVVQLQ
ncbi:MAG: amidohydrolase [Rhodobacteraceae bacterium]|nr:amidohydrolase [Paracoccaceae bacterium]